jgi:hypothetical protein
VFASLKNLKVAGAFVIVSNIDFFQSFRLPDWWHGDCKFFGRSALWSCFQNFFNAGEKAFAGRNLQFRQDWQGCIVEYF